MVTNTHTHIHTHTLPILTTFLMLSPQTLLPNHHGHPPPSHLLHTLMVPIRLLWKGLACRSDGDGGGDVTDTRTARLPPGGAVE